MSTGYSDKPVAMAIKIKHAGFNLTGRRKDIMRNGSESIRVLINHWRWLRANGYKKEATSCKLQAASLTRKNYNVIGESRRKKLCKQKTL